MSETTARRQAAPRRPGAETPRGNERSAALLARAAKLMAERGYHHTSMRDVAREAEYSLAGLYHYFTSKEDLLFQIQHEVFASLLEQQERTVAEGGALELQLERMVRNHLAFFTRHANELKVCAFELQSLSGDAYRRIEDLRRRYYRLVNGVVSGLLDAQGRGAGPDTTRRTTLFIFGMLNWIFMWFDPERDPAGALGDDIVQLVLHGLCGPGGPQPQR